MVITNIQTNEDAPENLQYYISGFDVEDRTFYGVNFDGIYQNQSGVKYDISTLMEGDILCIEYGSVQKKQNDIASLENNITGELIGIKKIILIARAKNLTHTFKTYSPGRAGDSLPWGQSAVEIDTKIDRPKQGRQ